MALLPLGRPMAEACGAHVLWATGYLAPDCVWGRGGRGVCGYCCFGNVGTQGGKVEGVEIFGLGILIFGFFFFYIIAHGSRSEGSIIQAFGKSYTCLLLVYD